MDEANNGEYREERIMADILDAESVSQAVNDEIVALEAIYENEFSWEWIDQEQKLGRRIYLRLELLQAKGVNGSISTCLCFDLPHLYPYSLPNLTCPDMEAGNMSKKDINTLLMKTATKASTLIGEPMIYELSQHVLDFIFDIQLKRAQGLNSSGSTFLRKQGETLLKSLGYNSRDSHEPPAQIESGLSPTNPYKSDELNPFEFITIQELLSKIPATCSVLRVENISRYDKFYEFAQYRDCVIGDEAKMEIMFHGTSAHNIASIIRNGLVEGGTRGINIHNGSSYGNGIYLARTFGHAQRYASREQGIIIVCAVVYGQEVVYDSSSNGFYEEFIVVGSSQQVLPLYLVHYNGNQGQRIISGPGSVRFDSSQVEEASKLHEKEAAAARAGYFLRPCFKVVDVADYCEDDDYTSYEMRRKTFENFDHNGTFKDITVPGFSGCHEEFQRARFEQPDLPYEDYCADLCKNI